MKKQTVNELKKEITELDNKWKRALADYQNLERRTGEEKKDFAQYANSELILKILPGLDSLEKAQEHFVFVGFFGVRVSRLFPLMEIILSFCNGVNLGEGFSIPARAAGES